MSRLSLPVERKDLIEAFRQASGALLDAEVEFALAGGFAVWARGGCEPSLDSDIDFLLAPDQVLTAARALDAAGFQIQLVPQGWLVKALHAAHNVAGEHVFVDLIHDLPGIHIQQMIRRATPVYVSAIPVPCLQATDLMRTVLMSMTVTTVDYTSALAKSRMLREQIDWHRLEAECQLNPVAAGFFDVARRLGVDPGSEIVMPSPPVIVNRLGDQDVVELRQMEAKCVIAPDDFTALLRSGNTLET